MTNITCNNCKRNIKVNPHNTNEGIFKCPVCYNELIIENWVQYMRKIKINRIMIKMNK